MPKITLKRRRREDNIGESCELTSNETTANSFGRMSAGKEASLDNAVKRVRAASTNSNSGPSRAVLSLAAYASSSDSDGET